MTKMEDGAGRKEKGKKDQAKRRLEEARERGRKRTISLLFRTSALHCISVRNSPSQLLLNCSLSCIGLLSSEWLSMQDGPPLLCEKEADGQREGRERESNNDKEGASSCAFL